MKATRLFLSLALFGSTSLAFCQDSAQDFTKVIDKGDTVWMALCTALVLFMTPGLALFYGGMVRKKNILSSMLHSYVMMGVVSVIWLLLTFTLAFGATKNGWIGGLDFLGGNVSFTKPYTDGQNFPAGLFMLYQMMFAIITPALISGALAERMKFGAYVTFTSIWAVVVYAPIACWVWNPNGWLNKLGALDFAGGTVVHLASGMAALAAAICLGKRKVVQRKEPVLPNNLTTTLLGAGLLWFGWIGFNAGSALNMTPVAISAFGATHMAAATGMLGWMICEKVRVGKATALGAASGLVAGLVVITPAAGFVSLSSATIMGLLAGVLCCYAVGLKSKFGFDDALDVVGVHGVGGFAGAILTGVFASSLVNTASGDALKGGRGALILHQLIGAVTIGAFSFVVSFVVLKVMAKFSDIRTSDEEESEGLDLALHGEAGYNL